MEELKLRHRWSEAGRAVAEAIARLRRPPVPVNLLIFMPSGSLSYHLQLLPLFGEEEV